jgi:hypothetical protein
MRNYQKNPRKCPKPDTPAKKKRPTPQRIVANKFSVINPVI